MRGNSRRASESSVVSQILVAIAFDLSSSAPRKTTNVANAVGTTCRGFEPHQLHLSEDFGAVAQLVEQYRFTILVVTIWNDRLKAELRTNHEQTPNARRDYIQTMSRLGKTLVGSFDSWRNSGEC